MNESFDNNASYNQSQDRSDKFFIASRVAIIASLVAGALLIEGYRHGVGPIELIKTIANAVLSA